jgi:SAM-dependent methyltransferase
MEKTSKRRQLYRIAKVFGFDTRRFLYSIQGVPKYFSNLKTLKRQKGSDQSFPFGSKFPILDDWYAEAGVAFGHYFHQDLFVAQRIFKANPKRHIDIGSRIDGFVAHIASFRTVEIIDIRDLKSNIENVLFTKADLMNLPVNLINSTDSISSLHAIEHFGLGRYGDPIDYFGYQKALENIRHMLKEGGKFYFSVPIGEQRIEFNAHRVFAVRYLVDLFQTDYQIDSFSFVDDNGDLHKDQPLSEERIEKNFGCHYGCGIFEMTKLS